MSKYRFIATATLVATCTTGTSLWAQTGADANGMAGPPTRLENQFNRAEPTDNATVNLIRLLVDRGILTAEDAVSLIRQAEGEARMARAQALAIQAAAEQIQLAAAEELAFSEEDIRVTYVPEHVRQEIAADVRHELAREARAEGWGSGQMPDWITRLRPSADFRVRAESILFPSSNLGGGAFPDFNEINTGAPFDVTGNLFSPQINTTENRSRMRLRLRLGLEADLADGFTLAGRIATGQGNSPVSTNQTMGSPGNFSRYAIWLDRAFLRWERIEPGDWPVTVFAGRFNNPFFATDIVWDDDIGFDGLAIQTRWQGGDSFTPFFNAGAFPVFNTALNFPTNSPNKFRSQDRYLLGAQVGVDFQPARQWEVKLGVGLYEFTKIEGQLSDPFVPLSLSDAGSTDARRPTFAQKGNTYMALRDILPVPANNFGAEMQYQYFGLASPFRALTVTARADYNRWEPVQISIFAEYLNNLAFDSERTGAIALNNRGPVAADGTPGAFAGGDNAWIAGIRLGQPALEKPWQWLLAFDYRYIESDAFVDGFVDSDFGLGGTNLKGFSLRARMALNRHVFVGFRWMSASEVAGPPLRSDILQIDLNSRF